jgi:hypothetical protein
VDVDRYRVELAVAVGRLDDHFGQNLAPMVFLGQILEVAQEAVADDLVELQPGIELHRGRGIAADDAVDAGRAGVLAAGDRAVDPGATGRAEGVGEHLDRRGLPTRGPPVDDLGLHLLRARKRRANGDQRRHQTGLPESPHWKTLPH